MFQNESLACIETNIILKNNFFSIINITLLGLGVYNLLYWGSKITGMIPAFHDAVMGHWKLITFLEFLAVASVAADIIIRYDTFQESIRKNRLFVTAGFGVLWMLKLIFGVIELYMRGSVS